MRNLSRHLLLTACTFAVLAALPANASADTASDAAEAFSATPLGKCSTIAPGTPPYRNTSDRTADTYVKIGTSGRGRAIWAEHWGASTGPQVLVVGQTHGDECSPAFLVEAIRLRPPARFGIWLIPTLNPDALAAGTRLTPGKVDLNRDGFARRSPETRALLRFTRSVEPIMTVHVHSPYGFVGSRNGSVAASAATAIAKAANWRQGDGSGSLAGSPRGSAFLWDGQERVLPKHPSVLVELPATGSLEAADAPQPERRKHTTPARARKLAARIRDALYGAVTTHVTRGQRP